MRSSILAVASVAVIAGAAACAAGSARPAFAPHPRALRDTLRTTPGPVIRELSPRIGAEGLQIQFSSEKDGYLETQFYNVMTRQVSGPERGQPDLTVMLRFWVDSLGPDQSVIIGEAVYKAAFDPSIPQREAEPMVPPTHEGMRILQRVMASIAQKFP